MARILRNGGSQSPDRWLKEPRNNHCIRLRYIGISGVLHNILIDSGVSRFGLEFKSICQKILLDYEKIDVVLITHVSDTQGDRHH